MEADNHQVTAPFCYWLDGGLWFSDKFSQGVLLLEALFIDKDGALVSKRYFEL